MSRGHKILASSDEELVSLPLGMFVSQEMGLHDMV